MYFVAARALAGWYVGLHVQRLTELKLGAIGVHLVEAMGIFCALQSISWLQVSRRYSSECKLFERGASCKSGACGVHNARTRPEDQVGQQGVILHIEFGRHICSEGVRVMPK